MNIIIELWKAHQAEIILFGKNILLTLIIVLLSFIVCRIIKRMINKAADKIEKIDPSVGKIFYSIARTFIWLFALLIILDRFGVNTASIITVLGTAGLAVGLAMKDSLSNVAAGSSFLLFHTVCPFLLPNTAVTGVGLLTGCGGLSPLHLKILLSISTNVNKTSHYIC